MIIRQFFLPNKIPVYLPFLFDGFNFGLDSGAENIIVEFNTIITLGKFYTLGYMNVRIFSPPDGVATLDIHSFFFSNCLFEKNARLSDVTCLPPWPSFP